jgi:hypothetical protein
MSDFATELEQLIRKHLGTPQFSDDYDEICRALDEAEARLAWEADVLPSRDPDEDEAAYIKRVKLARKLGVSVWSFGDLPEPES